ncbi:hypothetical protein LTR40_013731, partial [Exophiala xenobiotica]
ADRVMVTVVILAMIPKLLMVFHLLRLRLPVSALSSNSMARHLLRHRMELLHHHRLMHNHLRRAMTTSLLHHHHEV